MASPSNEASPNDSYNRLIRKALQLLKRSNPREEILAAQLARAFAERDQLLSQIRQADSDEDAPVEVVRALRSRPGADQVIAVRYDGMLIKAVLHPIGRRNPPRERAVWRCLRETAISVRGQHCDE